MPKVLFVTENSQEAEDLKNIFARQNSIIQVNQAVSFNSAIDAIRSENLSAIITHTNIGGDSFPNLLEEIQRRSKFLPVVIITDNKNSSCIHNGNTFNTPYVIPKTADYINKLTTIVLSAIEEKDSSLFNTQLDLEIIQNVDNPIIVTNLDSKILFYNHAAENLFN